jgi:hypothetical protein
MSKNVLLLDVDGVLNAITRSTPPSGFLRGNATPYLSEGPYSTPIYFPICYNPEIIARLLELHTSEKLEIKWLTTWGRGANWSLSELLSLPGFDVLADPEDEPYRSMAWQEWWKAYALRQYDIEHRPEKIIWVDDDIKLQTPNIQDILEAPHVMAICPDERRGLTMKHLDLIEAFLDSDVHSQADSVK